MKKRYTEEQIIRILREAGTGITSVEVCRTRGISERSLDEKSLLFTWTGRRK